MIPLFIDTDTASDDAVALIMAMRSPQVDIVGIGIVAGNVPLNVGAQNALFVRDLCESQAPVYLGAERPLVRELSTGQHVHGGDGMGDVGLVSGHREPSTGHAVTALIEAAVKWQGELVLVTLGPLTNVALALALEPRLTSLIKRCVVMGGAGDGYGNITPVSEFNFWCDPEAAEAVMASGLNVELVGWDISRKYAVLDDREADDVRSLGTQRAIVAIDSQKALRTFSIETSGLDGFDLPDPIAMAVFLNPALRTKSRREAVHVILGDGTTRGMMVIDDRRKMSARSKVLIADEVSRAGFMNALKEALQ